VRGGSVQARMASSIPSAPRFAPPPVCAPRLTSPALAPVIQRQLYKGKTPLSAGEVKVIRSSAGYGKLNGFKKLIVDYWIDDAKVEKQYKNQGELFGDATKAAKNPTRELVALMPQREFFGFAEEIEKPSKSLGKSIKDRTEELGKQRALEFKSTTLHFPELPMGASTSVDTEVGSRTGREQGAFFHGKNTLPNPASVTTSLPNIDLTQEMISTGNYGLFGRRNMAICPTCAGVDSLVYFEVDHQDPFSNIRDQLQSLALAMSFDKGLLGQIQTQLGKKFSDYFVVSPHDVTGQQLFPTKTGLQHYSNDMQNLMSICRFCNGAFNKSDQPFIDWFKDNPLYGKPFIDSLKLNPNSLIARTGTGNGIGKAAREWFNQHHWSTLKQSLNLQKMIFPIQQTIYEQTTASLSSTFESDPLKKAQHQQRSERLSLQNRATLSGMNAVSEYHTLPSIYEFAPSSPQRYEEEVRGVGERRQKRKRTNLTNFGEGVKASLDSQPKATVFSNTEEKLAYEEGYEEGAQQAKADYALGYSHGVQNILSTHASKHYHSGVSDGKRRLQQVQQQAYQDALKGSKDPFAVSGFEPEGLHLKNAYLDEFTTQLLQLHAEEQKKREEEARELERSRQQVSYQQSNYPQPVYRQPIFPLPSYQQSSYQQPSLPQSGYQQPSYQQPSYQQPSYQQQTAPISYSNYPSYPTSIPSLPNQFVSPQQQQRTSAFPLSNSNPFGVQQVSRPQQNQTQSPLTQQNTFSQPSGFFPNWQQK